MTTENSNGEKDLKNLSTEPYKGVRDFYPQDMYILSYIFSTMRKAVEQFGYQEYGASILEPTDLYKAKSGEEIVNEQTYSFKDRGDRDVTLRPEMTPTVTRMVAAKKRELIFPLRWYSIPNLFRYEKPQRGRLREHYQLNVDLFGVESIQAEIEVILVAHRIMKLFGAKDESFVIRINNRKILNYILEHVFVLTPDEAYKAMKLIDKIKKLSAEEFLSQAKSIFNEKTDQFIKIMSVKTIDELIEITSETHNEILGAKDISGLIHRLKNMGITNAVFDPTLARGFDYYTGVVFEVFDTSPENPRALFGGGRFDDLLSVFGTDKVPAVGFGMGDVTIRDYLETYNLLPKYIAKAHIMICNAGGAQDFIDTFAQNLRQSGLNVIVDISGKKVGQQIESASKQSIPYIIVIGEHEAESKQFKIKELSSGTETEFKSEQELADFILKNSNK